LDTKKFRTRQEFRLKQNPKGTDYIIALDAGYSGMKVFYENGYFCFPSFAKKLDGDIIGGAGPDDILYRDSQTGEMYMVGRTAQDMLSAEDTNDTDGEMFARKRYSSRRFRILCQTAIALALHRKRDNRGIVIQTGLPSSYLRGDTNALKKALQAAADFSLRVGGGPWVDYSLRLSPDKIFCDMPQPAGSLYSVLIRDDGKYIPDARAYLSENILIMDIGFGTFDFYGVKNSVVACKESVDKTGMHEVMQHASEKIWEQTNEDIRVPALQKILGSGSVVVMNEEELRSEEVPIGGLIKEASNEVFEEAFQRAREVTNSFLGYKRIVIAGGTGEAWYGKMQDAFSSLKTIQLIPSNFNDKLPFIYSNARGYYLFRYNLNGR